MDSSLGGDGGMEGEGGGGIWRMRGWDGGMIGWWGIAGCGRRVGDEVWVADAEGEMAGGRGGLEMDRRPIVCVSGRL